MKQSVKMLRFVNILLATVLSSLPVMAVEVTSKAGALSSLIDAPAGVVSLKVRGVVDASDLFFIAREMPDLADLDLGEVTIDGYYGRSIGGVDEFSGSFIPAGVFAGTNMRSVVLPSGGDIAIGDGAFAGSQIESVVIADNIRYIGWGAFMTCGKLVSVSLPDVAMGSHVFAYCDGLRRVSLSGLSVLGDAAFAGCRALSSVEGSSSLVHIGSDAFRDCTALTSFAFGDRLVSIGTGAFAGSAIAAADMSLCSGLRSIGDRAFAGACDLGTVITDDAVSHIGEGAFFGCMNLTDISFPKSASNVGDYTFAGDVSLDVSTLLHDNVAGIGRYSLAGMYKATEFKLPASLEYMGDNAMERWTSLVTLDGSTLSAVPELGGDVWSDIDQAGIRLLVDYGMVDSFSSASQWKEFDITGVDGVADESQDIENPLTARISGHILEISGAGMEEINIYDALGVRLLNVMADGDHVEIDISAWNAGVFIVDARFARGRHAALKVARTR